MAQAQLMILNSSFVSRNVHRQMDQDTDHPIQAFNAYLYIARMLLASAE
jgi:hypothetical protein